MNANRFALPVLVCLLAGCSSTVSKDSDGTDSSNNAVTNSGTAQQTNSTTNNNATHSQTNNEPMTSMSCTPDCSDRICGEDPVCGTSCGSCGSGACNELGQCGETICTAGDFGGCANRGEEMDWTGEECCVHAVDQCVAGDFNSCANKSTIRWTGVECCTLVPSICVPGDFNSCANRTDDHVYWTGEFCCVGFATTCTEGTFNGCANRDGMVWTGEQCCIL